MDTKKIKRKPKQKKIDTRRIRLLKNVLKARETHFIYYCSGLSKDLESMGLPAIWDAFISPQHIDEGCFAAIRRHSKSLDGSCALQYILHQMLFNSLAQKARPAIWRRFKECYRRAKAVYEVQNVISKVYRGESPSTDIVGA